MQHKLLLSVLVAAMPLALLAGPAFSDNGVSLNITNDGTDDIDVTVYDTTLGPKAVVLAHARINGFTTVPVSVSADETGHGNISWTAVTADKTDRNCGHADDVGLADSAAVKVRADSDCATITASTT
jgi:hypothetical protein